METELRYWETPEYREKYSDADREAMAKKDQAMPDGSYPIGDAEDLDNAIQAVGRGASDHDAIRKHIIKNAARLGQSDKIPDNWNADGSLKQSNSRNPALAKASERRRERHRAVPLSREVRFFAPTSLEVRREARADTDDLIITGSPIVYGVPYTVVDFFGEFRETIHAGSVSKLISNQVDCRLLLNHAGLPMARTVSGTMRLIDTPTQLNFEARLDARQQLANDFAIAIERGDLSQMSIGMMVGNDVWGDDGEMETRDIFGLDDLIDVSGVTYPCSPTTHIEVAQRMAMAMPVETRARLRRMEVELRAGKVLSASSQTKLIAALNALHDLAMDGGVDPASLLDQGDADDDVEAFNHEDGTDEGGSGNIESDTGITYADGTGGRQAEPEAEHREEGARSPMKASTLRLLIEAGRHRAV